MTAKWPSCRKVSPHGGAPCWPRQTVPALAHWALDPTALHRQTGGNPFFVTETIASGASGIPSSVRDAVLACAARLSTSGPAVLEAAALIGLRIEPPLLAAVATLIAQGKSNRQIAVAMTVCVKTIETYVTRILNKLGFDSRVQIATWTVEKRLSQSSHRSEC